MAQVIEFRSADQREADRVSKLLVEALAALNRHEPAAARNAVQRALSCPTCPYPDVCSSSRVCWDAVGSG